MATSSDQVHGQQYVDFDEYIDIQLRKTGSTIKTTDVMTAVVGILTLVTLYLLIFVICDHWIVPGGFGPATRGIMLAVVGSAACAWLVVKIIIPWRRRVSWLYAASTIEKASPALKSSLLNLVDITRSGHEVSPEIYQSIERRAALALTHVDVNEAVDRRSLLRLSNVLLAVVVLFCLYWIFSPKNPATSLWRAFAPSARVGVATRTEIFNVHPGDKDVLARSQLEVTADIRGELPPQTFLFFTTADRKFVDERVEMRLENEASRKFRCVLTGDNGGGILQNMTYRIVAGDATTPEYNIRVIQPPAATIESIRLDSPEYTRRAPVLQTTGAIDALEGTRVTLKARANMPLRSPASLQFFDDETASKRAEEIPIHIVDGTKLEVDWKLEIRSDGTYPRYYRIFCTNTAGESDPSPSLYSLAIRPDQPPEIILHDPKTDLELPANAVLPLLIEARDPDFALTYIDLNIEKDGSPVNGPTIYSERNDQQFKTTYKWSLGEYHFRPKETITYWLQAKDNRQPIANVTKTAKLRIHIIDPVSEEQVKKDLAAAQKRQQEEMNKSAEAERGPQETPEDEKQPADREKPQRPPQRPQPPKGRKPSLASEQQSGGDEKAQGDEKADEQNDQGQHGSQQHPGDEGTGKNGQKDKDQRNKDSAGGAEDEKKQPTDPDKKDDDPKTLQKLIDQQRREQEKKDKSSGGGQGDQGASEQNNSDQGKPDKNSPSQKQKDKKDSGSASDSAPQGDQSEKKSGKGGQKNNENPASGAKPENQPNGEEKPGDSQKKTPGKPEGKEQSQSPDGQKSDSTGSKPQGEKSSEAKKEGGNPNDSKDGKQNGTENGPQKGQKDGTGEGSPDSKEKPPKPDAPGDQKSKTDKDGPLKKDQSPNSNSQPKDGSKQDPSQSGAPKSDGQPEQKPEAKQPQANQGNPSDSGKGNDGKENGGKENGDQQKKSDAQSKSGSEAGGQKGNDQKNSNGAAQNQDQSNGGDSANSKNDDKTGQKESTGNQSKEDGTKQDGKQNAGSKESGSKQTGSKEPGKKDASQKSGDADRKNDADPERGQGDQKRDATRKAERSQKQPSDDKAGAGKTGNDENKEKTDRKDGASGDETNKQKARQDERRRKNTPDELSRPANQKAPDERPSTVRDKKDPIGGNESETGSSTEGKQPSSQQPGAPEERSRKQDSEQPNGSKTQKDAGADEKSNTKKPSGSPQEGTDSKDSKEGDGKPGDAKSGQPKPGDQASQKPGSGAEGKGQGKEGQKGAGGKEGKGQDGQSGAGKKGDKGQSNAAGKDGGKSGAGQGQSTKGSKGGGFNDGDGGGDGAPLEDTTNQANLDAAKKATDLVLNRLDKQLKRGEVDPKVMEELGWTKDQVRRFVDRMKQQAQAAQDPSSPASEARRLQFVETLKSLNLSSPSKRRTNQNVPKTSDAEIESKRSIPPPEYRDLYDAYTRSLAKPLPRQADDKK